MRATRSLLLLLCLAGLGLAKAPQSASMYYREAAAEYVAGRLPSAGLLCDEGLRRYPDDKSLQMLKERIKENQDKQKQKCDNPQSNDDKDKKDSKSDGKNKEDGSGNSSGSSAGSSAGSSSASSSASGQGQGKGQSSSSGKDHQGSQGKPSSASGSSSASQAPAMPMRPGELTPEQAQQLLKDFNQNTGERKPWKPVNGKPRPSKDW